MFFFDIGFDLVAETGEIVVGIEGVGGVAFEKGVDKAVVGRRETGLGKGGVGGRGEDIGQKRAKAKTGEEEGDGCRRRKAHVISIKQGRRTVGGELATMGWVLVKLADEGDKKGGRRKTFGTKRRGSGFAQGQTAGAKAGGSDAKAGERQVFCEGGGRQNNIRVV